MGKMKQRRMRMVISFGFVRLGAYIILQCDYSYYYPCY